MRNHKIEALIEACHRLATAAPESNGYDSEESVKEDLELDILCPDEADAILADLRYQRETNADALTVIVSVLNLLEAPKI